MKRFDIIGKSTTWLIIAACLLIVSQLLFWNNTRWSIEFTGGIELSLIQDVDASLVETTIDSVVQTWTDDDYSVSLEQSDDSTDVLVRTQFSDDQVAYELSESIKKTLFAQEGIDQDDLLSLSLIGPSIGEYMKSSARDAIIIGLILMAIYMIFSFASIRRVVPPVSLAAVTIVTMLFDISIPAGAYGLLMSLNATAQIDTVFIIALLTTIGYSINDTIIIFDRIRENATKHEKKLQKKQLTLGEVIEDSLWQTMRRSLGTSISTLLVVIAMYILGAGAIASFAYTIGFGILAGTFSSIFVAAPLVYVLMGKQVVQTAKATVVKAKKDT